jgi:hypothetical protein
MSAGIVLLALGVKKTLAHVDEPLKQAPAFALCAGIAFYYLAHVAFRLRNVRTWAPRRVVISFAALAMYPLATHADALVALACVSALPIGLTIY